jgi:hypothetical protein
MTTNGAASESRWSRLAPLSGAIFIGMYAVAMVLIAAFEFLPSPEEAVAFFEDNSALIGIGGYIATASTFFLLWFSGSLQGYLASFERGTSRISTVALGGGVAASAMILISSVAFLVAAARAGGDGVIGAGNATLAYDLGTSIAGNGLPIALAALVGATAMVSFRTGAFPRWMAWTSVVVALVLLSPINYWLLVLALPWIVLVSIRIYITDGRREAVEDSQDVHPATDVLAEGGTS